MNNIDQNVAFGSKFCSYLGSNYCGISFSLSVL